MNESTQDQLSIADESSAQLGQPTPSENTEISKPKSKPGFLDNYAEVLEDFEARNTSAAKPATESQVEASNSFPVNRSETASEQVNVPSTTSMAHAPSSVVQPEERKIETPGSQSIPNSHAVNVTSHISNAPAVPVGSTEMPIVPVNTSVVVEDDNIPVNEDGIPVDMEEAMEYLLEPLKQYQDVALSENLLLRKKEEDEGVQPDSDFEGEDFEDLLELFDIDPDEISLDLSLMERQKLLVENFDSNQLDRYEYFRRANLSNSGIKKLVSQLTGQSISSEFSKILAGIGKVFVGEIVERAKDAQRKQNEAKVEAQLEYKRNLRKYELDCEERSFKKQKQSADGNTAKSEADNENDNEGASEPRRPEPPLIDIQDVNRQLTYKRKPDSKDTSSNYRIIIPDESVPLTPDHIREAWRVYQEETANVIKGGWRKQGGGDGNMFR